MFLLAVLKKYQFSEGVTGGLGKVDSTNLNQMLHGGIFINMLPNIWAKCRYPRDPITLSEDDWGVQSPPKRKVFRLGCTITPKRKVFRFHCHYQKVIGSLGVNILVPWSIWGSYFSGSGSEDTNFLSCRTS